jgi:hypothetical protein
MCSPFDPLSCKDAIAKGFGGAWDAFTGAADDVAQSAFEALFQWIADGLRGGVKDMAILLAGWILVPSTQVCPGSSEPGGEWVARCATSASPAAQLRGWMLPLTILIAVAGIIWQGITMAVSRKGEPLLQAIRGTWNTALWGAVGIAGTQLALRAGDDYSFWILQQAVFGNSTNPVDTMGTKIGEMAAPEAGIALIVLILMLPLILFVTLTQIVLMIFREGSVVILAGVLQLAAAGTFTRSTSGWLQKVVAWMLALVTYKPIAATVYATGFLLMGASGIRNFVMGLAVMALAIIAMPALMKFFSWSVGSINAGGGGLGMLGAAAAAGVHAGASLRGVGGFSATDHARYLEQHGPSGADSGSPSGSSAAPPGPPPTPTASASTGPSGATGPSASGAGGGAATAGAAGAGGTAAAGAGTASAAGSGAAAGAATTAAGGAAATGVGIPVAVGIVAAQGAVQAGKQAADAAGEAMQDGR